MPKGFDGWSAGRKVFWPSQAQGTLVSRCGVQPTFQHAPRHQTPGRDSQSRALLPLICPAGTNSCVGRRPECAQRSQRNRGGNPPQWEREGAGGETKGQRRGGRVSPCQECRHRAGTSQRPRRNCAHTKRPTPACLHIVRVTCAVAVAAAAVGCRCFWSLSRCSRGCTCPTNDNLWSLSRCSRGCTCPTNDNL